MIRRDFWLKKIETAWRSRPIVRLSGARRVGKTSLARMLPDAVYLNCDLASTARRLEDPEAFFKSQKKGGRIILDEVHRLPDPSNVLKIAADSFHHLRILATGSSTLAATRKFRDALTGRKWAVYLCPVLWDECRTAFGIPELDRRLLQGGLPEPLLADAKDPEFFVEWMDSYYARDISELFGLRDRAGFLNLLKLLMTQSGGLVDYSKLASESGLSRPTVRAHIEAMTVAHAVFPLRPFHGGGRREIIHRPKVYAFDTGFVTFARGWDSIRDDDRGLLWEHLVLDTLRSAELDANLGYWRDKSGRELDFTIRRNERRVDAVECKINPDRFDPELFRHFRSLYPDGNNWVVSPWTDESFHRRRGELEVRFLSTKHILAPAFDS
ncbi:MAG: AAA family ATPase [Candidatus Aureabacteria bacterium]|nr:AAA family ATPase [Candidatus Auribacterota bacterium]